MSYFGGKQNEQTRSGEWNDRGPLQLKCEATKSWGLSLQITEDTSTYREIEEEAKENLNFLTH